MPSSSRIQLEDWLSTITASGNILDVGGSQLPIQSRINVGKGSKFKILDLKEPHELKSKPQIKFDLNSYKVPDTEQWEKYDVAFCIEVSEYWWNPLQALRNISYLLKPGGILYCSFHFIYPVHNPVDQDYLRYTPRGVEKLMSEAKFEIEEMKPRLLETYVANIDGMRPAKNYDKHTWQGCLVRAKKL